MASPQYDIVVSFAGEDRPVADALAAGLVTKGLNVFYDEYAKADLWGKDLYVHLTKVYKDDGKFCLMLLSESYAKKQWTSHERRAAQARAFTENTEYILPLRLDSTSIDGILPTTGYIDYHATGLERVIDLLVQKVNAYNKSHGIAYRTVSVEEVFREAGITPQPICDSDFTTRCPSCSTVQALSESPMSLDQTDTLYTCKHGCQTIVVVSRPGIVAWPGRGYVLGEHAIRNASDLFLQVRGAAGIVKIPASKAALMKTRPAKPEG